MFRSRLLQMSVPHTGETLTSTNVDGAIVCYCGDSLGDAGIVVGNQHIARFQASSVLQHTDYVSDVLVLDWEKDTERKDLHSGQSSHPSSLAAPL
jgi:hypothetical protein